MWQILIGNNLAIKAISHEICTQFLWCFHCFLFVCHSWIAKYITHVAEKTILSISARLLCFIFYFLHVYHRFYLPIFFGVTAPAPTDCSRPPTTNSDLNEWLKDSCNSSKNNFDVLFPHGIHCHAGEHWMYLITTPVLTAKISVCLFQMSVLDAEECVCILYMAHAMVLCTKPSMPNGSNKNNVLVRSLMIFLKMYWYIGFIEYLIILLSVDFQGPLLLTWFNFNPIMDK